MRKALEQRLQELKTEHIAGQKTLAELEAKAANVRETLLRISGAIQVLEEELARAAPEKNEREASADGSAGPVLPVKQAA